MQKILLFQKNLHRWWPGEWKRSINNRTNFFGEKKKKKIKMKLAGMSFLKISYLYSSSNPKLSIVCFQAPFLFQAPPGYKTPYEDL